VESIYPNKSVAFESVLTQNQDRLFSVVRSTLDRLEDSPGSRVGPAMGNLGQVPSNVRLSDCCAYTRRNGLNHLGSFSRAMDIPDTQEFVSTMLSRKRVIFVDLGSGASLTWILTSLVAAQFGQMKLMTVVNVDHSKNMNRVAREIATDLSPMFDKTGISFDRRQVIEPAAINGYTSSELEDKPPVFLVLNHLLHQNHSTNLPVPEFVTTALRACRDIVRSSGGGSVLGVSLEPWGLRTGFGQQGLNREIQSMGGSTSVPVRVAGDNAGKSVVAFKY
jgi:hypothetical protein